MKSVVVLLFTVAWGVCVVALIIAVWNFIALLRHVQPGVEQSLNPIHYLLDPSDLTETGAVARRRVIVWGGVFLAIVLAAVITARVIR